MPCIFCNKSTEYGIELSDGNIIHNSCYKNANIELNELYKRLEFEKKELVNCNDESGIIMGVRDE